MTRALSPLAALATLLALAACNTPPAQQQQATTPAPTGITSGRGGGTQSLGNTGTGNPIATTPTTPVR